MTAETGNAPRSQRLRALLGACAAVALLLTVSAGASAASSASPAFNPASNIPIGTLPHACASAPRSATCVNAIIVALNRAHSALGLGRYLLPADFDSLSGSEQLLILCNLDRIVYGLPPISGLSPVLNAVAATGVAGDEDPDPSALLTGMDNFGWSSNWAGGYGNAPEAYYAWMYYDGWGGKQTSNLDCTSPTASGCWGHREDVLAFAAPGMLSMGASVSRDTAGQIGYAVTLVWTTQTSWTTLGYTWATAQSDGAGVGQRTAAGRRPRSVLVRSASA